VRPVFAPNPAHARKADIWLEVGPESPQMLARRPVAKRLLAKGRMTAIRQDAPTDHAGTNP